ncbi:potassium transporter Kup [Caulobacter sp. UNC279MFTsu5.1]|uniref:potassium transporter Kup n=1 Tax=Caulobacter sp. UNC279MFTsu5.1 TaxID=1502775 RepID=UPI0003613302|nr:potassium transporter Kup [Caulobacter sp. UNC279MFTsu5.1]SFI94061.1 KUP system potassium uptake protein [Caulobacter sp. UNC279MFTsu5.1]
MAHSSPEPAAPGARAARFGALWLGAIGVVFGDIGTSPLYAMREALAHAGRVDPHLAVFGVVSLVFWALTLVVTLKYVVIVMRADNGGEGGTLALMALAQNALQKRSAWLVLLGIVGAALFYGDGLITPAISVLSAVEGLTTAPVIGAHFQPFVLPLAAIILLALFAVQSRGTEMVGRFFGPITLVWFATLAALGLPFVLQRPDILLAFSPVYAIKLLVADGPLGVTILGSVFLCVTGAEALYADMGHFGKGPIRAGWLLVALPCLMVNYLGQGALCLIHPAAMDNPFFGMIPHAAYWPVMLLTTAATIIASQAVITGAFSVTQQAVQLGLLPRIDIKRTSETVAGQIFVPQVNAALAVGVLFLLFMFKTSSNMASAYGVAVTTTMVVTVALLFVVARRHWKWPLWASVAVLAPFLALDLVFLGSNALKIAEGGWVPLAAAGAIVLAMWTWRTGSELLHAKVHRDSIALVDLIDSLRARPPHPVPGTAIFLTSDPSVAPVALLHNLKHNKVLHAENVIMTVRTADQPRVAEKDRIEIEPLGGEGGGPGFRLVTVHYGFMETPNIPRALGSCRRRGLVFDLMSTSFFVGRRTVVASPGVAMPLWQDRLFIWMVKNAADPIDYFHIPAGRVVEMGSQVVV